MSEKGYLDAVERNGWSLEFVPEEHKTPELCLLSVQQYGLTLQYVPEEHRTPNLCLVAVKQYGWALEYVPDHLKEQIKKDVFAKS